MQQDSRFFPLLRWSGRVLCPGLLVTFILFATFACAVDSVTKPTDTTPAQPLASRDPVLLNMKACSSQSAWYLFANELGVPHRIMVQLEEASGGQVMVYDPPDNTIPQLTNLECVNCEQTRLTTSKWIRNHSSPLVKRSLGASSQVNLKVPATQSGFYLVLVELDKPTLPHCAWTETD